MTKLTHKTSVLTGDLVGSADLDPAQIDRAFAALSDCADVQSAWHSASLHFTRHRGDGWQVVLPRSALAIRSALAFRAALRASDSRFDSYMSLATGDAPAHISADLNVENAAVFIRSGNGLDKLKLTGLTERMIYQDDPALNALTVLADHISQGWTLAQAAAILPVLAPDHDLSYTDVAKSLGKSRQAVTKALEAAGYTPLRLALLSLEADPRNG